MCSPSSWKQKYVKIIQFGCLFLMEGSSVVCVKAGNITFILYAIEFLFRCGGSSFSYLLKLLVLMDVQLRVYHVLIPLHCVMSSIRQLL